MLFKRKKKNADGAAAAEVKAIGDGTAAAKNNAAKAAEPAEKTTAAADTAAKATAAAVADTVKTAALTAAAAKNNDGEKPVYTPSANAETAEQLRQRILNAPAFSYDPAKDPLYAQYREQYTRAGRQAAEDTAARAAGLTGGYGSSYAVTASDQAYKEYLAKLNEILPTLEQRAYDRYKDSRAAERENYDLYAALSEEEYNRYRDLVNDWYKDRADSYTRSRDEAEDAYRAERDRISDERDARDFAYRQDQDTLAQNNLLMQFYAKYPQLAPGYTKPSKGSSSAAAAADPAAASGSAGGIAGGIGSDVSANTVAPSGANIRAYLAGLTPSERTALYSGRSAADRTALQEIRAAVGEDGLTALKKAYPGVSA